MSGKPQCPEVYTLTEDNTSEHGLMLGMYIDTTFLLWTKAIILHLILSKLFFKPH